MTTPFHHKPEKIDVTMHGNLELNVTWVADKNIREGDSVTIVWPVRLDMMDANAKELAAAVREVARLAASPTTP